MIVKFSNLPTENESGAPREWWVRGKNKRDIDATIVGTDIRTTICENDGVREPVVIYCMIGSEMFRKLTAAGYESDPQP